MSEMPTNLFSQLLNKPSATIPQVAPKAYRGIRHLIKIEPESQIKKEETLTKSILNMLNGGSGDTLERLAFERDPSLISEWSGIYRPKISLIPDFLLKRMALQDDLVAAIVRTRSNHLGQFGRQQQDRHSLGFCVEVEEEISKGLDEDQQKEVQKRIRRAEKLLLTCGYTEGWANTDRCSFSEFLYLTTANAITVGRSATEVIYTVDPADPTKRKFHSFRPTDAGTVYFAAPNSDSIANIRQQSLKLLADLHNEKLKPEKFENDEYQWVQVIQGRPVQAFGSDEMLVCNYYPSTNIELQGYPVSPMDTALAAVTTHLHITTMNKAFFSNGRASRGMLVIQGPDLDENIIATIKQQFNASINGSMNSYRMPVFGIGAEDKMNWVPLDASGGRDMEFQYLSDQTARVVMAAFQISPEEVPGYQHLTRGTNSQALSEGNNEYKLSAARDVGIRPHLRKLEDHLSSDILPLIDPELAKIARVRLKGLEADTEEKESVRIQQDAPLHGTYDFILSKVGKDPIGKKMGGILPLNPSAMQLIEKYLTFGQILEYFTGLEGASKKPEFNFYQNPFFFQWYQMQMQQQQAQAQAQQQQEQPQGQPGQDQGQQQGGDLSSSVDQAMQAIGQGMQKSEKQLTPAKRKLKKKIEKVNKDILKAWGEEQKKMLSEVGDIVEQHVGAKEQG
jgi:hypothetical protein